MYHNQYISDARRSLASVIFLCKDQLKPYQVINMFSDLSSDIRYSFLVNNLFELERNIFKEIESRLRIEFNIINVDLISDEQTLKFMPISEDTINYPDYYKKYSEQKKHWIQHA